MSFPSYSDQHKFGGHNIFLNTRTLNSIKCIITHLCEKMGVYQLYSSLKYNTSTVLQAVLQNIHFKKPGTHLNNIKLVSLIPAVNK